MTLMTCRTHRTSYVRACSVLILGAAAACRVGDDVSTPPGLVVRDSSSIEILENRTALWEAGQPWEVADTPSVALTPESADSAHLIWKVRGAARLGGGSLAVLSGGARQLLVFDRTGSIVRAIGGPGEGPGEFTSPTHLQRLPGDTLVVWERHYGPRTFLRIFVSDGEHFQVDVFDDRGKLRRIIRRTTDPVPITPQRRREARERIMAWNNVDEDGKEAWVRRFDRLPPQTHHPAVHDLFIDREGYLWAAHTGEGWNVFAPSGRWLGTLRIPLERLYDVGSDFVVGWTFDESLRERIVEYRLRRVP